MSEFNLRHKEMTPSEKRAVTLSANKAKQKAGETLHRELLELMLMSLRLVLQDEDIDNDTRFRAVELMNGFRKELCL